MQARLQEVLKTLSTPQVLSYTQKIDTLITNHTYCAVTSIH
jgi:hypothetical protein